MFEAEDEKEERISEISWVYFLMIVAEPITRLFAAEFLLSTISSWIKL